MTNKEKLETLAKAIAKANAETAEADRLYDLWVKTHFRANEFQEEAKKLLLSLKIED